ncbi:hypothetical protein K3495_g295 [Podosphaera aphanis]|nr:hypothetical protein K3495_g295 [Podosphaera aphanis]
MTTFNTPQSSSNGSRYNQPFTLELSEGKVLTSWPWRFEPMSRKRIERKTKDEPIISEHLSDSFLDYIGKNQNCGRAQYNTDAHAGYSGADPAFVWPTSKAFGHPSKRIVNCSEIRIPREQHKNNVVQKQPSIRRYKYPIQAEIIDSRSGKVELSYRRWLKNMKDKSMRESPVNLNSESPSEGNMIHTGQYLQISPVEGKLDFCLHPKVDAYSGLEDVKGMKHFINLQATKLPDHLRDEKDIEAVSGTIQENDRRYKKRRKRRLPVNELVIISERIEDSYFESNSDPSTSGLLDESSFDALPVALQIKNKTHRNGRNQASLNAQSKITKPLKYDLYRRMKYEKKLHQRKYSCSDGFEE